MKFASGNVIGICALLLACAGCSDGMVDLQAKVLLDGKPLDNAAVTLMSYGASRTRSASGMTDEQGIVRFSTFGTNDGVLPGTYKVVIVKSPKSAAEEIATLNPEDPKDLQRIMDLETKGNVPFTRSLLPRAYLNPDRTPLSCEVTDDVDELVFELDSSFGK